MEQTGMPTDEHLAFQLSKLVTETCENGALTSSVNGHYLADQRLVELHTEKVPFVTRTIGRETLALIREKARWLISGIGVIGTLAVASPAHASGETSKTVSASQETTEVYDDTTDERLYPRPDENVNQNKWGYRSKECVWFAGLRLEEAGVPEGRFAHLGQANEWIENAANKFELIDNEPAVGAVIVISQASNGAGHIGVVELVDKLKGTVTYSEYNGMRRHGYSVRTISLADAQKQQFIHFEIEPVADGAFVEAFYDKNLKDEITKDAGLFKGSYIVSPNGEYKLLLTAGGNLVLYDKDFNIINESKTKGKGVQNAEIRRIGGKNMFALINSSGKSIRKWPIGSTATSVKLQNNGGFIGRAKKKATISVFGPRNKLKNQR